MGLARPAAWALAALVVAVGAGFPAAVAHDLGGAASWEAVGRGALRSAAPAVALAALARWADGYPVAEWTAAVGAGLTLALGVALYAAALGSPSPVAPAVAVGLVPLRQATACAFVAWGVWLARRAR